jgi:hypothetical protein
MGKKSAVLKVIGYAFGTSIAASLIVLLIGMCVFGFQLAEWAEWQGRIAGVVGTIAGVAGAAIGWQIALRAERRAIQ